MMDTPNADEDIIKPDIRLQLEQAIRKYLEYQAAKASQTAR